MGLLQERLPPGGGASRSPAPFAGGERRHADRVLAGLRARVAHLPRPAFHCQLALALAELAGTQAAFVAAFPVTGEAPALRPLGYADRTAAAASAPLCLLHPLAPEILAAGRALSRDCLALTAWLRRVQWLGRDGPPVLAAVPLLACDDTPIGLIGLAGTATPHLGEAALCQRVEAFARLAERLLENDQAARALALDRSRLEGLVVHAMDAIVCVDARQNIVRFNAAAERMYQRKAADVLGGPLEQLLPPEHRAGHRSQVEAFGTGIGPSRPAGVLGVVQGLRADGSRFPAEIAVSRMGTGAQAEYTAIVRDLSERERMVSRLMAAESMFRSLVEQSLVGIFIVQNQRFRYLNPCLAELFACTLPPEQLERIPFAEFIVPAQRLHVMTLVRDCLRGRRTHFLEPVRALRRDGRVIEVEMHGKAFTYGGRAALIGVVTDVTTRRQAEGALRQSEQLFQSMFEAMNEAVVVHEFILRDGRPVDYRVLGANPAFERHTGTPPSAVVGRRGSEIFPQGAPLMEHFAALASGSGSLEFETYFEPAQRRLQVSAFALDRQRFVSVFQDVTRQRRLEQEDRARAQELGRTGGLLTLGEMASTLAHELNQPLTSIANFSAGSLMRIDAGSASLRQLREILALVNEEAERAGRILNGIRRFMVKRDFQPAPVDANEMVMDVIGLPGAVPEGKGFALGLDLGSALPPAAADRVLVQVVLLNLIRNGVDALQDNGARPRELKVRTQAGADGEIQFSVSDNGCGLPPGPADAVFQAFFTTKDNGAGLGLAIARSIVESHGGRIWATRNSGHGSTFHFSLPPAREP